MRLIPLFVAVVAAIVLFMSAPIETAHLFSTTDDYVRQCNTQSPSDLCKAGFRSAAVRLAAEDQGRFCDHSGGNTDAAKNQAAWESEIPHLVAWLVTHPQPGNQGYLDSLGVAMVAVYPCK
jgi:hypothetical protein